jgi:hypothetical protein
MEGGSVPGGSTPSLQQSQSCGEDREAVIHACYELVCSGRPFSEILVEAGRLSGAIRAVTAADNLDETGAAGAPCAGTSEAEKLQTVDAPHAPGPPQVRVPSRAQRPSPTRPPIGLSLVSLVAAICGVTAIGISRISVWPLPVETGGAQSVASDSRRETSPGSDAQATIVPVDASRPSVIAPLTLTAATTGFEDSEREYPARDKHPSEWTERPTVAHPSVLLSRKRARYNGAEHRQTTTVPLARGIGSSPSPVPHAGLGWQYDRLIGRYVPLAGSSAPRYQ